MLEQVEALHSSLVLIEIKHARLLDASVFILRMLHLLNVLSPLVYKTETLLT